eukprot:2500122-Pyramimonas_sp.AAC.1
MADWRQSHRRSSLAVVVVLGLAASHNAGFVAADQQHSITQKLQTLTHSRPKAVPKMARGRYGSSPATVIHPSKLVNSSGQTVQIPEEYMPAANAEE